MKRVLEIKLKKKNEEQGTNDARAAIEALHPHFSEVSSNNFGSQDFSPRKTDYLRDTKTSSL